ncbi:3-phosphoshikimate 1-carboxyvinyltransferase [Natronomonas gomsonensis]|uniref:3-phosphoshikimate 1-carboxyvinyltransferase n=1 Tax=Natronomonas gomsonensis TaxID=1046043 RepID=UPI0020CA9B46|nr:3-phosphoshikimate 1-carboxyvinyltransferase [Natronomonas gomsonensis]MCY4729198.1 3-phosphoshikimate 1-carboxyvinyltransferase [Natronomonas gomsonensis]
MDVRISPSRVRGSARAPPSKSYTHRAILAAGYGGGALVKNPLFSADTKATARAVEAYGGSTERVDDDLEVVGFEGAPETPGNVVDCANSGTTMRLTAAAGALLEDLAVLTGDASLRSRPQGPLLDALGDLGARAESTRRNGQAPLVVGDGIDSDAVSIRGDVSSQYITGLLMAGAVTEGGLEIDLTTDLKSAPYVDITLEVLADFGIDAEVIGGDDSEVRASGAEGFRVPGGQSYEPTDGEYHVPGDFSSMSYLLAAGALAADGELLVEGAYPSAQGDSAIVSILERMGADIEWDRANGAISVAESELEGIEVGVADTPDLLPTIAVLGAAAEGATRITDCEHVRLKETDRVAAMATELTKMGVDVEEYEDELVVHGGGLEGATVEGYEDHRIVMSLAVAALVADGETTIEGAEHVDVSFPEFFEVLYDLGADVEK